MTDFEPDLLHRLVWELDRSADRLLRARCGLPYSRAIFLFTLQRRGTLSQHELALALGYSDPAVSSMLRVLRAQGLVTTARSPEHGRKRLVSITAEGRAIVRKGRVLLETKFGILMVAAKVDRAHYTTLTTRILEALLAKQRIATDEHGRDSAARGV